MTLDRHPTQTCLDAWINCENLVAATAGTNQHISSKLIKLVDECALVCMGTFHALAGKSKNISRIALLCMGICEECAEACEMIDLDIFRECSRICRTCADSMSHLAFTDWQ